MQVDYLKANYTYAVAAGKEFSINPVVILAQAALESGWGKSYGARIRKNHFGITRGSGTKNKYYDGAWSWNDAKTIRFRIYRTVKDSFFDFARLIKNNYKEAANVSADYAKYAKAIAYSPYISETNGDNRPAYQKAIIINSKFVLANLAQFTAIPEGGGIILPAIASGFIIAVIYRNINKPKTKAYVQSKRSQSDKRTNS